MQSRAQTFAFIMTKIVHYDYSCDTASVFLQLDTGGFANVLMFHNEVNMVCSVPMDKKKKYLEEMKQYCRWQHYLLLFRRQPASSPGICAICQSDIQTVVTEMLCGHSFHRACILKWFETHNICPVCRQELFAENCAQNCKCPYYGFRGCNVF